MRSRKWLWGRKAVSVRIPFNFTEIKTAVRLNINWRITGIKVIVYNEFLGIPFRQSISDLRLISYLPLSMY